MSANSISESVVASTSSSLGAKLLNVFVYPSEVFDEVLAAPPTAKHWGVPTLLACVSGIPLLQVTARYGEGTNTLAAPVTSSLAVCLGAFAGVFWCAFVIWFTSRVFLKIRFAFGKALEVAGLASIILVLGNVVTMLLIPAFGDAHARPALSLLARGLDLRGRTLLDTFDLFQLWSIGTLAVGLSRLSGATFKESGFWVFGYWIFMRAGLILLA
jgi:hypothetical protein